MNGARGVDGPGERKADGAVVGDAGVSESGGFRFPALVRRRAVELRSIPHSYRR